MAYVDADRDGVQDAGESPLPGHQLLLTSAAGQFWSATTDSAGRYAFSGLTDGLYRVEYDTTSYASLRDGWVPTTTASLQPWVTVQLAGTATVPFGWRPIVRSTDANAPLSTYTGPSGLRVESFDDVVPARQLHDQLASGYLTGEAPSTVVEFDFSASSSTSSSYGQSGGSFTGFAARSFVTYASWRDRGAETLSHEYGHAWATYHAAITRQDPALREYLQARGLAADPRVGTSYAWMPDEMIAEDYRQLLGPAAGSPGEQMNRDIPPASQVTGLRDFLTTTFVTPVATAPAPAPAVAPLTVDQLSAATSRRGTDISFRTSLAGTATVRVLDSTGRLVRSVTQGSAVPSGTSTVLFDGKDSSGRKVKLAGLSAVVVVTTADGRSASGSVKLG